MESAQLLLPPDRTTCSEVEPESREEIAAFLQSLLWSQFPKREDLVSTKMTMRTIHSETQDLDIGHRAFTV